MKPRNRFLRTLSAGMLFTIMVALWIFLAPSQFGGQSSYVMVAGASMEPTLHRGDLVVIRETESYDIGDIATYRHPTIGPIIHRIIDRQGEHFIFKGDNNEWIDSYEPVASELIGSSWVQIPGAANWLLKLRMPAGLALLSLGTAFMVMITLRQNAANKDGAVKKGSMPQIDSKRVQAWAGNLDGFVFTLGAVALGAFILGIFAFRKPLTIVVPDDIAYEHQGSFSYHRGAPPSIYDNGMLTTGDAIFHQFVPLVDLDFDYHFKTGVPTSLQGTYSLSIEVGDPSGWRRSLAIIPETPFNGDEATLKGQIDVQQLVALTDLLRERTGYQRQVYSVKILPIIMLQGEVGGKLFQDRFTPQLNFQLDEVQMYLQGGDPLSGSSDPLSPNAAGFIPNMAEEPATLSILGLDLTVESARWIAGIGFSLGVLAIAGITLGLRTLSKRDPMLDILLQYGPLLVEVEQLETRGKLQLKEIQSIGDMAKLAQMTDALIFYQVDKEAYKFQVRNSEQIFQFNQPRIQPDTNPDMDPETGKKK